LVDGEEIDRELFQETERVHGLGRSHAPLDDVKKFTPVDPIQDRAGARFFLIVKGALNNLPARFTMIETHQGKTIEDELFAHGAPLLCVRGEDLALMKIDPLKNPSPLRWDQEEPG
jgi:hypothetical protein